jgi:hypothetical protein
MEEQLSKGFDEFVTLYFPGPKKPWEYRNERELMMASLRDRTDENSREARRRRFDLAQTCQRRWLTKIRKHASPQFRYLMVIEDRTSRRDFMFHLLLGACDWGPWDFNDHWGPLWKQMSGGIASKKQIDERIGGLLWHFIMKKDCVFESGDGTRYSKGAFEEWKPC